MFVWCDWGRIHPSPEGQWFPLSVQPQTHALKCDIYRDSPGCLLKLRLLSSSLSWIPLIYGCIMYLNKFSGDAYVAARGP